MLHVLLSTMRVHSISAKSGMENYKMLLAWQAACSTGQTFSKLHVLLSTARFHSISAKFGMQNCKVLLAWQAACSTGQNLSMLDSMLRTVTNFRVSSKSGMQKRKIAQHVSGSQIESCLAGACRARASLGLL